MPIESTLKAEFDGPKRDQDTALGSGLDFLLFSRNKPSIEYKPAKEMIIEALCHSDPG